MRVGTAAHYILKDPMAGAEKMERYGYRFCDYRNFMYPQNEIYTLTDDELREKLESDREILASHGITIYQVHGLWQSDPNDGLPEDREMKIEKMIKGIRATRLLGAEYFVLHPFMPFGYRTSDGKQTVLEVNREAFGRLCAVAREVGVTVCLENMPFPRFPLSSVAALTAFVKEMGEPNLKLCLDTGHALICGESPADAARLIGKELLAVLHVHDNFGEKDEHLLPGKGAIDWQAFADALAEVGYEGVFSYETGIWERLEPDERLRRELELYRFGEELVGKI